MKFVLSIIMTAFTLNAFAQSTVTIDDLGMIDLNLDQAETALHDIHYPNYRMGGGNGASRQLRDCLILDIRHSDVVLTQAQKLSLAKAITLKVGRHQQTSELAPVIDGKNVVLRMPPANLYMTSLQAATRNGKTLNEVIGELLPPVRPGNTLVVPTSLVYVRDCRF